MDLDVIYQSIPFMGVFVYQNELRCLTLPVRAPPVHGPFSIKNIRKNEDLVLAFTPRVLPKGRSMLSQNTSRNPAFCFDLYMFPPCNTLLLIDSFWRT